MTKHAYIRTENVSLSKSEIDAIAADLALACIVPVADAHEKLVIITSVDGKTTISEGLFDDGLLTVWLSTQQARVGVNVEDFMEPMTRTVEDPDTGEDVVEVVHQTRQSAAAADCRRWLGEHPEFYPVEP